MPIRRQPQIRSRCQVRPASPQQILSPITACLKSHLSHNSSLTQRMRGSTRPSQGPTSTRRSPLTISGLCPISQIITVRRPPTSKHKTGLDSMSTKWKITCIHNRFTCQQWLGVSNKISVQSILVLLPVFNAMFSLAIAINLGRPTRS